MREARKYLWFMEEVLVERAASQQYGENRTPPPPPRLAWVNSANVISLGAPPPPPRFTSLYLILSRKHSTRSGMTGLQRYELKLFCGSWFPPGQSQTVVHMAMRAAIGVTTSPIGVLAGTARCHRYTAASSTFKYRIPTRNTPPAVFLRCAGNDRKKGSILCSPTPGTGGILQRLWFSHGTRRTIPTNRRNIGYLLARAGKRIS